MGKVHLIVVGAEPVEVGADGLRQRAAPGREDGRVVDERGQQGRVERPRVRGVHLLA